MAAARRRAHPAGQRGLRHTTDPDGVSPVDRDRAVEVRRSDGDRHLVLRRARLDQRDGGVRRTPVGDELADDAETTGLVPFLHEGTIGMVAGGLLFVALAVIVARMAMRKVE